MNCPKCQTEIESLSWRFCDRCGEPLCILALKGEDRLQFSLESSPQEQTFQVTNAGGGLLSVLITTNRDWLTATPQRFLLAPSEAQVVSVSVHPEGASPGIRQRGKIILSAGDPDADPTVKTLDIGVEEGKPA